jgi:CHAT domain-containing protein
VNSNFIQSYIPTLSTLVQAHSLQENPRADFKLTAVGVTKTTISPGIWPDLPSIEHELDTVTTLFGTHAQKLQDSQASITNVVDAMKSSAWLHLACHGEQDPEDSFNSGLILSDGKLSLQQILDIDLTQAKFVYLSACETAMGDERLQNEAMHLAGGFLTAGFQGAIGTLWSMSDADGPNVAEMVYETILGDDKVPDVKMAAKGLHLAIQMLRKNRVPPYRWMPFIHFGV